MSLCARELSDEVVSSTDVSEEASIGEMALTSPVTVIVGICNWTRLASLTGTCTSERPPNCVHVDDPSIEEDPDQVSKHECR